MRLSGEDTASAVREWVKDDIKNGPSSKIELGKFFFGVSSGTLGLFATLLKFAVEKPSMDPLTVGCFAVLLLSTLVSLSMASPPVWKLEDDTDLYAEYSRVIQTIKRFLVSWYILWIVGFTLGAVRLFC